MRRSICLFWIILGGVSHAVDAQTRVLKNEISIGQVAGYFFDSTPVALYRLASTEKQRGFNVQLNYTRLLNEKFAVSIMGMYALYTYVDLGPNYRPGLVSDFTVLGRQVLRFSSSIEYRKPYKNMEFRFSMGPNFMYGNKWNHYFFFELSPWREPIREWTRMGKIGLSSGASWTHPIWRRTFGTFNLSYLRLFKAKEPPSSRSWPYNVLLDPNHLYFSYSIGLRF